jgi:hypothetical protein
MDDGNVLLYSFNYKLNLIIFIVNLIFLFILVNMLYCSIYSYNDRQQKNSPLRSFILLHIFTLFSLIKMVSNVTSIPHIIIYFESNTTFIYKIFLDDKFETHIHACSPYLIHIFQLIIPPST